MRFLRVMASPMPNISKDWYFCQITVFLEFIWNFPCCKWCLLEVHILFQFSSTVMEVKSGYNMTTSVILDNHGVAIVFADCIQIFFQNTFFKYTHSFRALSHLRHYWHGLHDGMLESSISLLQITYLAEKQALIANTELYFILPDFFSKGNIKIS